MVFWFWEHNGPFLNAYCKLDVVCGKIGMFPIRILYVYLQEIIKRLKKRRLPWQSNFRNPAYPTGSWSFSERSAVWGYREIRVSQLSQPRVFLNRPISRPHPPGCHPPIPPDSKAPFPIPNARSTTLFLRWQLLSPRKWLSHCTIQTFIQVCR